jgi:DNA-binding response OmpR family regulator
MPRVLHIDADEDVRFLVGRLLEDAGHDVHAAATAWEGIRLLQEPEWRPDLVLLDVRLPEVSGWDLLTWIRAQPPLCGMPVVLSTVRDDDGSRARARELGCAGFLVKPFDVRDLVAAVEDVVAQVV